MIKAPNPYLVTILKNTYDQYFFPSITLINNIYSLTHVFVWFTNSLSTINTPSIYFDSFQAFTNIIN